MNSGKSTTRQVESPKRSSDAKRIAVIGAGYVGLPTAGVLAHYGHQVVLAERDADKLDRLVRGELPIVEDGLGELLDEGRQAERLRFVASASEAVADADFVFLCVPTPEADTGAADLRFIEEVAAEIAPHLRPGAVVVNKSTVPVGTATLVERTTGRPDVFVVSNPEFLREGSAVRDSLHPDRLVVGGDNPRVARAVGELFAGTGAPLIITDPITAETIKYASNAFLATKLSFVNALANLCEAVHADVRDLVLGLGYDRRIGFDFLRPGPGWGGSCLPKDTRALLHIANEAGYDFDLLRAALRTNDEQIAHVVDKIRIALGSVPVEGSIVTVWGLTFKAGTDDRRNSPSLAIIRALIELGTTVRGFDPTVAVSDAASDLEGIELCGDPYDAARDAHVLAVLTEWHELRDVDFTKVHEIMAVPALVDARNLLDPPALRRIGFTYDGIGRI